MPASSAAAAAAANNLIALSPNYAAGLLIGVFLLSKVVFAVSMLLGVETSDKMAMPDHLYQLPKKKVE